MVRTPTREQMIATGMRLFQRDGYHATSWRRLVEASGTPWGSVRHHFPEGKEQLGAEVIALGQDLVAARIDDAFTRHADPSDAVRHWFGVTASTLESGEFRTGCRVATVVLETTPESERLTEAARTAFARWQALLAEKLVAAGISPQAAPDLATMIFAALEGALILSRVSENTRPLAVAAAQLGVLLHAAGRTS